MESVRKNKFRSSALFITLSYLVFGVLWITISGEAAKYFTKGYEVSEGIELYKGIFFIIITSLLLYLTIRRREKQREKLETEILTSEKKYRTLVEASHELIWSTDDKNIITFVNNASRNIYGLEPEKMIGSKFSLFATPGQINEVKTEIAETLKKGEDFLQYESHITDSNGREKYLLTNCILNIDSDGKLAGMYGTSLDITERVESVERVKYHNRVYSLLTNINQLIVRAKDEKQILKDACRLAVEYGMFQLAWIGIVDDKTGNVIPEYFYGDSTDYLEDLNISINEKENVRGPIIRAFQDKIYYVSNDIENDVELLKWKKSTLDKGFRSFATFPIEVKNKVVAVYNIYSKNPKFFGKKETELLLELTEDISFALEYLELEKERMIIEDRYKNIVEKAPIGIFTQLNDVITYINPEGYKMLGAGSYSEIVGKNITGIIHPDYMNLVLKRQKMLEKGESASEIEEKFNKADGSEINVMVSAIPYSQNGQKGAQVFFRDLTEQIKTRKEMEETNERFKLITKAANDALWDWDLLSNDIWWNDGFKDLFGYNEDEIEKGAESWMNKIHENDKQRVISGIELAISAGHDFWFDEYSFRKKDGTYSYVFDRGNILKNSLGKPYRMVGSMIDITYRRQMEKDLKLSEEKWRSLFENSPSIIFTIDNNYIINSINRSIKRIFDKINFIGKSCFELFHKDEKISVKKILDDTFKTKEALTFTVKSAEINNKQSYFTVQVIPQIKNSEVEGLTLIATDITEKMLSEEKIKETNESLHALAAHLQTIREEERTLISREIHDQLGQELTALKMDIAFLSKRIEKAKVEPDWEEINNGLRSMSDITDQTINSVRRIARDLRPDILDKLGLREAIEWQAEEFTKRTGIDCIVSLSLGEFNFSIDLNTTVFRIIQESLTNVARHSGATRSKIGLSIIEKFLYLTIEDNGRGISENEIENTKSLGLVGIKERAYSVNGKFTITGKKEKGTILKITIPLNYE